MVYEFHISKKQLILGGVTLSILFAIIFLMGYFLGHINEKRLQLAMSQNMKAKENTKKDEIIKQNDKDQDNAILNRDLTFEDILKIKRDIEKKQKMHNGEKGDGLSEKISNEQDENNQYRKEDFREKIPKIIDNHENLKRETEREKAPSFGVQVGAFVDRERADVLQRRLKSSGYKTYIIKKVTYGIVWHRVIVGNFHDRERARKIADDLANEGFEVYITSDLSE